MRKAENCIGKKFGRLTVEKEIRDGRNFIHYLCRCECGKEKTVYRSNLINGKTKSCGCEYKRSAERLRTFNSFTVDYEKQLVVGKTTNTKAEFMFDLEDFEKVKQFNWYEASNGYITHKDRGKPVLQLHRFITDCPQGKVVDHMNHNKKDNRKKNLRVCTQKENANNRIFIARGKLKEFGITEKRDKGRTYYVVQLGGKYRGCFVNLEDAKKFRDELFAKF